MKLPRGDRHWLLALWLVEACVAAAAVLTLARGGAPRDLLLTLAYFALCALALTLPGPALRRAAAALGMPPQRRRLVLQLYLALAAAAVAATLGTARGWAAVVAILLMGNALLTLEVESRAGEQRGDG
jgi:NhaP-type Na+/H+ or K+/H+ antiporter